MILLILFIVVMFLWLLVAIGAVADTTVASRSGLLAWFAVLLLFLVVHGARV